MHFHKPLLWAASLTLLLLILLGRDSLDGLKELFAHLGNLDLNPEFDNTLPVTWRRRPAAEPWDQERLVHCHAGGDQPDPLLCGNKDVANSKHVHNPFAGERVSTDRPNVSLMESMVPTLAELTEAEWVSAVVPPSLLNFVELRTSKLVSLAQIMHADVSLSLDDRCRFMERLLLNVNAVTRVGDKLCGEINNYATRVTARALEQEDGEYSAASSFSASSPQFDTAAAESASSEAVEDDLQDAWMSTQAHAKEKRVRVAVLNDLKKRNAGWREAIRVCRTLTYKMEHYRPIIDELVSGEALRNIR